MRGDARVTAAVLAIAATLRAVAAWPFRAAHHDEIWQYLEPAYHLVAGPWVMTWEQRDGIRSWLVPVLAAGPMALGHAIDPLGSAHLLAPRLAFAALSLVVVAAATALGLRLSRLHGVIAGLVTAGWFELVYMAPRVLSETAGLAAMMAAVWVLFGRRAPPRTRGFALAGLLIGLSAAARLQYAPALLVLAAFAARRDWRSAWLPLVAGGVAALAIDAAIDAAMGQVPLRWAVENVRVNIVERRAEAYGVSPPWAYLDALFGQWRLAIVPLLMLAWIGARRYPALAWMALVHLAVHSAIAHKEWRFILPSVAITVILAAIGTADVIAARVAPRRQALAAAAAVAAWLAASAALSTTARHREQVASFTAMAEMMAAAGRAAGDCPIAIDHPFLMESHALTNRRGGMYLFTPADRPLLARKAAVFPVVVAARPVSPGGPYRLVKCADDSCLFVRPGGCSGAPPPVNEINRFLADRDR